MGANVSETEVSASVLAAARKRDKKNMFEIWNIYVYDAQRGGGKKRGPPPQQAGVIDSGHTIMADIIHTW